MMKFLINISCFAFNMDKAQYIRADTQIIYKIQNFFVN